MPEDSMSENLMPGEMSDGTNQPQELESGFSHAMKNPIVRFLLSALLGVMFPLVYLSYVWYFGSSVTATQLWFLGVIAVSCGMGGAILGEKFFPYLMGLIESLPSL